MHFDKMHGLGNDFVLIKASDVFVEFTPVFIQNVCHRKFGIGCDTLVLYSFDNADCSLKNIEFFNADGSRAEICGNALRCLGLLMYKRHGCKVLSALVGDRKYTINTNMEEISVNMGQPTFNPQAIGIDTDEHINLNNIGEELSSILGMYVEVACVSVGNPHVVIFSPVDDYEKIGNLLNNRSFFKNGINVSFAKVIDNDNIELQVFERGVGLTLACGSAACATGYLAWKNGLIGDQCEVRQPGGSLKIAVENGEVIQSGRATYVFSGDIVL